MEKFNYKDLEHMKKVVKKEIIRMSIQDKPTIKDYNKGYIRGAAPSPSLILSKSKMTWIEFMTELGFKPDRKSNDGGRTNHGKKYFRTPKEVWENPTFRERAMDECVTAMREGNYGTHVELSKNLKKDTGIGYGTFLSHGFVYSDFVRAYKEKYDELPTGVRSFWKYCTEKELIDGMENLFKLYSCTSWWDYQMKNHDSIAPDPKLLMKKLGKDNVYTLANGFAARYGKFGGNRSLKKNKNIGKRWA